MRGPIRAQELVEKPSVRDAIDRALVWRQVQGGAVAYIPNPKPDTTLSEVTYKNTELAALSPLLPGIIQTLRAYYGDRINKDSMRTTLKFIDEGALVIPGKAFIKNTTQSGHITPHGLYVKEANTIGKEDNGFVRVGLAVYRVSFTQNGEPFAHGVSNDTFDVRSSWMDTQYPGWREKYAAGIALDLPVRETAKHIFHDHHGMGTATNLAFPDFEN